MFQNPNIPLDYQIVAIGNKALYAEGHKGITLLNNQVVSFKVPKGIVVVSGENLSLEKITDNTIYIKGSINKIEYF